MNKLYIFILILILIFTVVQIYRIKEDYKNNDPKVPNILIIRTHHPSTATIKRIQTWVNQFHAHPLEWKIWISIDQTNKAFRNAQDELVRKLENHGNNRVNKNINIHTYTEQQMEQNFPTLKNISQLDHSRMAWQGKSLAWGFHWETLCLLAMQEDFTQNWAYAWVIEDDIGYTGNLAHFCSERFKDSRADLITRGLGKTNSDWPWYNMVSPAFETFIDPSPRYVSGEHCQRFSRRFFEHWVNNIQKGIHAWSELGTPTSCIKMGYDISYLSETDIGSIYSSNGIISEEQWKRISSDPTQSGKLFHALKF
jgi:hypothetical protein